jgi:primary-amine oxidase
MAGKDLKATKLSSASLSRPALMAVDHDHYFSYRLDLDVDGVNNSLMVDKLVPYKLPKTALGRNGSGP